MGNSVLRCKTDGDTLYSYVTQTTTPSSTNSDISSAYANSGFDSASVASAITLESLAKENQKLREELRCRDATTASISSTPLEEGNPLESQTIVTGDITTSICETLRAVP